MTRKEQLMQANDTYTHMHNMHTHTQGVRPIPEEAEIVTRLTEGFFTQLDPEDDVIFDTAGKNLISRGAWCICICCVCRQPVI